MKNRERQQSRARSIVFMASLLLAGAPCVYGQNMASSWYGSSYGDPAVLAAPSPMYSQEVVSEEAAEQPEETYASSEEHIAALQKRLDSLQETTDSLKKDVEAAKGKDKKEEKPSDPFKVKFTGQLAIDGTFLSQNNEADRMVGDSTNSLNFRDLRLTARGAGHGNLAYAWGIAVNDKVKLLDNYVRFKDTSVFGDITIGHQFVESGMESVEWSFDRVYATIDEGSSVFRLSRRLGVSSAIYGEDKRTRAFFGVFAAPSITNSPHEIYNDDPGFVLDTRVTAVPVLIEDEDGGAHEVLHFGGSFFWLCPSNNGTLNLKTRGLGWMDNNPYFLNGTVSLADRSYSVSEAEVAWQHEGFATTAEGYVCSIDNGGGTAYGSTVTGRWLLTPGCTRKYVRDGARFGGVKMADDAIFLDSKNRTIGHNLGAWEVIGKWEWTEARDLDYSTASSYGTVNRLVAGMNWFLNEQVWMGFNWERAFVDAHKGADQGDLRFDTFLIQTTLKF